MANFQKKEKKERAHGILRMCLSGARATINYSSRGFDPTPGSSTVPELVKTASDKIG